MQSSVLWIVVALLLGLGAGYLLGSQGGPDESAQTLDGGEDAAVRNEPNAPTLMPATSPAGSPAATAASTEALGGDGVIRGTVRDAEGKPLAGVVVVATAHLTDPAWAARPGYAPPPETTTAAAAEAAALRAARVHAASGRAVTGKDGTYEVTGLGDHRFFCRAYARGYRIHPVPTARRHDQRPPFVVDFTATAVGTVRVQVLDPDGQPVAEAQLRWHKTLEPSRWHGGSNWTPAQDWIDIPLGKRWLSALAGADNEWVSDLVPVVVDAQAAPDPVVLRLRGRPGIYGLIRYRDPLAAPRPSVYAVPFEGEERPDVTNLRRLRSAKRGRTDRDGKGFRFEDLAPGRYLVAVELSPYHPHPTRVVELVDQRVSVEIDVPPLDRSDYMPVRVVEGSGKPVLDARFMLRFRGSNMAISGPASSVRLEDGSYLMSRHPRSRRSPRSMADFRDGTFELRVISRTHGEVSRPFDPTARALDITLAKPVDLEIRLLGLEASGLPAGAQIDLVDAVDAEGISLGGGGQAIASKGAARFPGVQPGSRRLQIVARADHGWRQLLVLPLEVRADRPIEEITLPVFHALEVKGAPKWGAELHCLDPAGNWTVEFGLRPVDGVVRFEHVAPGSYELRWRVNDDKRSMRVQMGNADKTVTLR